MGSGYRKRLRGKPKTRLSNMREICGPIMVEIVRKAQEGYYGNGMCKRPRLLGNEYSVRDDDDDVGL